MGLISQIPVYPAGYTVEDVLDDAFADLHAMEREMTQLAETMGQGEDQAAMARYDKLTAAFQAGGGYEMDTNKNKVCNGLSISAQMRQRPFDKLSGGEKTRVNLGRLILEDTDILLLDEPTNHLDVEAKEELKRALEAYKGNILLICHEPDFYEGFATKVWDCSEWSLKI